MNHFSPRQHKSEVKNVPGTTSKQTPTNESSTFINAFNYQQVLQMQRQLGNKRVMQMLRPKENAISKAPSTVIQKKDIDYTEKKASSYSAYEKLNNRRIELEIPITDLPNYTFERVLMDKFKLKNMPTSFQANLETGLNTLVIKKFSANPSKKQEITTITIEISHPRDFTERGDLSKTMKFGTEFTFTNEAMIAESKKKGVGAVDTPESINKKNEWAGKVKGIIDENYKETTSKNQYAEEEDVFKFTFDDGWWFQINLDPGVVEIQMEPMTLDQAGSDKISKRINKYIFGIAAELGLFPDASFGGGHIHLDIDSTFGSNELLFRNFIVDFENEAAALEAFEHDPVNAPRIAQQNVEMREKFAKVVHDFDRENKEIGREAIKKLAALVEDHVYKSFSDSDPKYNALNYRHMLKEDGFNTLEIRALRSQRNFDDFLLEAKLFMKRIEYLEKELVTKHKPMELPKFNKDVVITDSEVALESETKVLQALSNYCKQLNIDPEPYLKMASDYRSELYQVLKRDKETTQ